MPASLFADMDRNGGLEGQRALQLALELSLLGLNNDNDDNMAPNAFDGESRSKKSQNMTECVPVPSSEHVAEIVGRQGCKIKALRAKTNTYIKTPVRGEEPVFVVTGRKEDVAMAKREILSAAEHFSQIRASRKNNMNGSLAPGPPNNVPGQTTIQVRVPYRVVGLVVGPKGATIKRIQQQTHTYIVTPSRDKEPVFEVTGMPDSVENAKKEIEAHIAVRTGGMIDGNDNQGVDFHTNSFDRAYNDSTINNDFVSSFYKSNSANLNMNAINSAFSYCDSNNVLIPRNQDNNIFSFSSPTSNSNGSNTKLNDFQTSFSNGFSMYDHDEGISESPTFDPTSLTQQIPSAMWPDLSSGSSSLFRSANGNSSSVSPPTVGGNGGNLVTNIPCRRSSSISGPPTVGGSRLSPTLTDGGNGLLDHPPARRIRSDPLTNALSGFGQLPNESAVLNSFGANSTGSTGSMSSSPTDSLGSGRKAKKECMVCYESEVVAALVPCGHNLFCMECANRLCDTVEPKCPMCNHLVHQAIRIYS
ncbi:RNA-binding protein mex3b [Chamberlinius hualienensis]